MEEINLYQLLKFYANKWKVILFVTLLGLAAGLTYTNFIQTPIYKSEATLFLINEEGTQGPQDQTLINNYVELFESRRVLSPVIEEQDIDLDYKDIQSAVTASAEKDTDVIKVAITTTDAKQSQDFMNAAITSFKTEAEQLYGADKVQIVDEASLSQKSDNVQPLLQFGLASAAGFMLAIIILFFIYDFRLSNSNQKNASEPVEDKANDSSPSDKQTITDTPQTTPQISKTKRQRLPLTRGIARLLVGNSDKDRDSFKNLNAEPTTKTTDIDPALEAQLDDTIYGAPDFDKGSPEDINPVDLPMPPDLDTVENDTVTPDNEKTIKTDRKAVKETRSEKNAKTDMTYEPTTQSDSSDSDEN